MAKKVEQKKMTTSEILDKCIETVNYLAVPVATVASIWGYDISIYVAAGCGAIASVLSFVKLFCK